MSHLQDKVVLITGASSGIGAALAREFAARGAHLVLAARRKERLEQLAAELAAPGRKVVTVACDVTREGDVAMAVRAANEGAGPIDVVVANAGFGVVGNFETLDFDDYARQWDTNVWGVMRTLKATLADLKKTHGRIAIVGSVNGYVALPGNSPYAMSKFAIRALAESLAGELRPYGISVTHVAPGFIDTEIRKVDNQGVLHPGARDKVPQWIQMPAPKAARTIVRAIAARKREAVITGHGKFFVWWQRFWPSSLHFAILRAGVSARPEP